jgi:hypothetical protein
VDPQQAVVAGSSGFVDAMLPLLTERLGGAPRVADSPHLASALCQGGTRLLVYEHGGREWLSLCGELRGLAGPDLIVVAAIPPEHAADVAEISGAASAVVAWRGDGRPVLEAASRVIAARDAPPAPARRTGPVLTPQPSPVLTPQPARPAPTPTAPRPRPVMASGPRPSPTLTPQPAPALTPRPAPTPFAASPVRAAPTPGPALTPRPVPAPRPALTPQPARPAATPAAGPAFDEIFDEASPDEETGAPVAPVAPIPSVPPSSAAWPGSLLSAEEGFAVVRAALSGLWPEQRLRPVTEKVVAALSTAEKAAALGQVLPFDGEPVRRAVGLRWQVAAALDSLPPTGTQVDQPAVQAILGGIDDVLAVLKGEADDAAPETLRALEAVRHALVKEAIDLTEALSKVAPSDVVEEITTSRRARRTETASVTRMVYTTEGPDREPRQVPWGLVVVLALAVAGGAAYHGYRYVNRPKPVPSPVSGAPSGTVGTVTPQAKVVVAPAGAKVDPQELENFKNLERAKGNVVRELVPGTFVVHPENAQPSRPGAPADPGAAPTQGATP